MAHLLGRLEAPPQSALPGYPCKCSAATDGACEALARFLEAVGDRDPYPDEPDYDRHWLDMLVDAAGVSFDVSKIGDIKKLIGEMGLTLDSTEPPRHRAEADAQRLALVIYPSGSGAATPVSTR